MGLERVAARDAAQQPDRVRVARVAEHVARGTLLDELAGIQHADTVAHLRDHAQVVRDEQERGSELLLERQDQLEDLGLDRRVERGRRLVEDQQRRLGGERHCDHNPLQHPTRQLVRVAPHHPGRIGDPHLVEHLLASLERLLTGYAGDLEHLCNLTADADRGVQRTTGLLVDHRDGLCAQVPQRGAAERQHVAAVDGDPSARDTAVAGQVAHHGQRHRRLPAARFADEAERLPRPDAERDVAQHERVLAADAVADVDVLDGERVGLGRRGRPLGRFGLRGHRSNTFSIESEIRLTATTSDAIASASNNTSHQ